MLFCVFYVLYHYTSDLALEYDDDNRTAYKRPDSPFSVHHLHHGMLMQYSIGLCAIAVSMANGH
jgi:hypothetical protein